METQRIRVIGELVKKARTVERYDNIDDRTALAVVSFKAAQLGANAALLLGDDYIELYLPNSAEAFYWDNMSQLEGDIEWAERLRNAEVLMVIRDKYRPLAFALRLE